MGAAMSADAQLKAVREVDSGCGRWLLPSVRRILCVALGALALILFVPEIFVALGSIDVEGVARGCLLTLLFVWWDAIVPGLPERVAPEHGCDAGGDPESLDLNSGC